MSVNKERKEPPLLVLPPGTLIRYFKLVEDQQIVLVLGEPGPKGTALVIDGSGVDRRIFRDSICEVISEAAVKESL